MDLFTLAARLTMDTTAFITQMNQASNKGELVAAKLHTAFKASALGIANALGKVSASALNLVGNLAKSGFEYNVKMEEYQTSFQTLLGSTEKAAQRVQQLKEMAAKTPFGMSDLAEATKTLLAFQVEESKTNKVLSMLGDIALGNKEKLSGLALVFGQVSSAGKLSGQDLMQFINQGFNPLNYIAQRTGESMEVLRERMSKGKVTVQEVEQAFVDATSEGGQFYKGMDTASQTTSGLWSTLQDNFDEFKGKLMEPVNDAAKNTILPFLLDSLEKISNALFGVEEAAEPLFGGEDVVGKNNNIFSRIFETWSDGLPEDDQLVQDFINEIKSNTSLIEEELASRIENLDGKYGAVEIEGYKNDLDTLERAKSEVAEILKRRQNGIFTAEDTKNLERNQQIINDLTEKLTADTGSSTAQTPWAKFVDNISKLVTSVAGTWVDDLVTSIENGTFEEKFAGFLEDLETFIEDITVVISSIADVLTVISGIVTFIPNLVSAWKHTVSESIPNLAETYAKAGGYESYEQMAKSGAGNATLWDLLEWGSKVDENGNPIADDWVSSLHEASPDSGWSTGYDPLFKDRMMSGILDEIHAFAMAIGENNLSETIKDGISSAREEGSYITASEALEAMKKLAVENNVTVYIDGSNIPARSIVQNIKRENKRTANGLGNVALEK